MLYLLYILDSQFVISARIWLEGLIFTYKRGRLSATSYRSDAAGRCCRGRKRGEKIKTGRIIGIACGISVYCACHQVLKSVFQRRERREWEGEETEGGGKPLGLIVGTGELEDTRGLYPAYPLSTPRTSIAVIPSPFLVISRAIVVALFIMALQQRRSKRAARPLSKAVTDNRSRRRRAPTIVIFILPESSFIFPRLG